MSDPRRRFDDYAHAPLPPLSPPSAQELRERAARRRARRAAVPVVVLAAAVVLVGGGLATRPDRVDVADGPTAPATSAPATASPASPVPATTPPPPSPASPSPSPIPTPTPSPSPEPSPSPTDPAVTPAAPDPPGPAGSGGRPAPEGGQIAARYGLGGPQAPVAPNTADTAGSGCLPGSGPLPDGIWAGHVTAFAAGELTFDLVCFRTPESAPGAAIEDWSIGNDSPQLRTVPVAADARYLLQTDSPRDVTGEPSQLWAFAAGDLAGIAGFLAEHGIDRPLGWLEVTAGQVVEFHAPPLTSA